MVGSYKFAPGDFLPAQFIEVVTLLVSGKDYHNLAVAGAQGAGCKFEGKPGKNLRIPAATH